MAQACASDQKKVDRRWPSWLLMMMKGVKRTIRAVVRCCVTCPFNFQIHRPKVSPPSRPILPKTMPFDLFMLCCLFLAAPCCLIVCSMRSVLLYFMKKEMFTFIRHTGNLGLIKKGRCFVVTVLYCFFLNLRCSRSKSIFLFRTALYIDQWFDDFDCRV